MKRIIGIVVLCIVCATLLIGCCSSPAEGANDEMFVKIYNDHNYDIVYHKDTKVMYAISRGNYNQGTFTLLVNALGHPLLYEE